MANASEWEAEYEAHRFDDEKHEAPEREPVVHARADIDDRTFPCGVDARAMVFVGNDADVTCDGCNSELQRRANLKTAVVRTSAALAFAFRTFGRGRLALVEKLQEAVNAGDVAAITEMSPELMALAHHVFYERRAQAKASAFLDAVNAARPRVSREEAVAAFGDVDPYVSPF